MLQTFAVSVVSERPDGNLVHRLHIIEADNIDTAEGRVLARSLKSGGRIRGLISRSCELEAAATLASAS